MMKRVKYIAAFVPEEDGQYSVYFPDVAGAYTCGATLEEAYDMAEDVLKVVLQEMAAANKLIPAPGNIETAMRQTRAQREGDGLSLPAAGVLYQFVPAPSLEMTPVRINISLPKSVLTEVDRKAAAAGMTRSGFLAAAAAGFENSPAEKQ
jgi:predicted RNase H-like HicB family nuclease